MTQVEMEQKIKEMRAEKAKQLYPLQVMINDIKERQTSKRQLLYEIHEQLTQLEKERQVIAKRMTAIINEWDASIGEFIRANYTGTRTLENISVWALAKELNKRGFHGQLLHDGKDGEFMEHLNAKLNTKQNGENTEQEDA